MVEQNHLGFVLDEAKTCKCWLPKIYQKSMPLVQLTYPTFVHFG